MARVTKYYSAAGQRIAVRVGGTLYFLHADPLGSLSEVTMADRGISARQRYWPYGQVRYTAGTPPTSYNFTGQRLDGTGLVYYGARYYDPALMRFTQPDTLVPDPANPQALNRYAYVLNNPLRYTDPTGHANEPGGGLGGTCTGVQCLGPDWQVHWAGLHWWQLPSYVQTVAGLGPEGTALDAHSWDVEWGPAPGNATDVAGTLADPAVYASAAAGGATSGLFKTVAGGVGGWLSSTGYSFSGWCASNPICSAIIFGTTGKTLLEQHYGTDLPPEVRVDFAGWQATQVELPAGTQLYRVHSAGGAVRPWWSTQPPAFEELGWRIDLAVRLDWGNTARQMSVLTVPEGQTLTAWIGQATYQGGIYIGGGSQVWVPSVPQTWITTFSSPWYK